MQIDAFCKWSYAADPKVSPDGQKVVFQVTKVDKKKNTYTSSLWLYRKGEEAPTPLTQGQSDRMAVFFPDSKHILFTGKRRQEKETAGRMDFYTMPLSGGEASLAFSLYLQVDKVVFLDADTLLLSGSYPFARSADWTEVDRWPAWINGAGYVDGLRPRLYRLDLEKAIEKAANIDPKVLQDRQAKSKEAEDPLASTRQVQALYAAWDQELGLEALTEEDLTLENWAVQKDRVWFSGQAKEDYLKLTSQVYVKNLQTGETKLLDQGISVGPLLPLSDGKACDLLYSDMQKGGINENPKVRRLFVDGTKLERTGEDFDASFFNSLGSDARQGSGQESKLGQRGLYFVETLGEKAVLSLLDENGKLTHPIANHQSIESFDFANEKEIYYLAMDQGLAELYVFDGKKSRKLTDFSKAITDPIQIPESFSFESSGDTLTGFVLYPEGYQADHKYPGLLWIHGGPKTALGPGLYQEMQWLASEGYFVFFTNPHGSSGFGQAFSDIRGRYGMEDYQDLMAFTDQVLERFPAIDSKRLGVLGGSYGGFMTNWIIGHTDRFAAANAQRSISNWTSFYGVSDIGHYFAQDQTAANPWDNLEDAWRQSPLKYAPQAKTPTLFIHAEEDVRCPLEQGMQMVTALQVHGVPSRMVIFKGENHELSRSGRPQGRLKRLAEIKAWFDQYLKAGAEAGAETEADRAEPAGRAAGQASSQK